MRMKAPIAAISAFWILLASPISIEAREYSSSTEAEAAISKLPQTNTIIFQGEKFEAGKEYHVLGKVLKTTNNYVVIDGGHGSISPLFCAFGAPIDPETRATLPTGAGIKAILRYKETKETEAGVIRVFECVGYMTVNSGWNDTEAKVK